MVTGRLINWTARWANIFLVIRVQSDLALGLAVHRSSSPPALGASNDSILLSPAFSRCGGCGNAAQLKSSAAAGGAAAAAAPSRFLCCLSPGCVKSGQALPLPNKGNLTPHPSATCPLCNYQVCRRLYYNIRLSLDIRLYLWLFCRWCKWRLGQDTVAVVTRCVPRASADLHAATGSSAAAAGDDLMPCFKCVASACQLAGGAGGLVLHRCRRSGGSGGSSSGGRGGGVRCSGEAHVKRSKNGSWMIGSSTYPKVLISDALPYPSFYLLLPLYLLCAVLSSQLVAQGKATYTFRICLVLWVIQRLSCGLKDFTSSLSISLCV